MKLNSDTCTANNALDIDIEEIIFAPNTVQQIMTLHGLICITQ